jgi:hypothetical protein
MESLSTHESFPHLFFRPKNMAWSVSLFYILQWVFKIYILYIFRIRRPNALWSACFYEGACNNTPMTFCYDLIGLAFSGFHVLANHNVFFSERRLEGRGRVHWAIGMYRAQCWCWKEAVCLPVGHNIFF